MRPWSRSTVGSTLGVLVGSLLAVVSIPGPAGAAACDITWDGGGEGTSWTDNTNWVGDIGVPGAGDIHLHHHH